MDGEKYYADLAMYGIWSMVELWASKVKISRLICSLAFCKAVSWEKRNSL